MSKKLNFTINLNIFKKINLKSQCYSESKIKIFLKNKIISKNKFLALSVKKTYFEYLSAKKSKFSKKIKNRGEF